MPLTKTPYLWGAGSFHGLPVNNIYSRTYRRNTVE
jgi:hypothetical protein